MTNHSTTRAVPVALTTLAMGLLLAAGGSYLFAAWSGPTQTPPNGNVEAPVNVGPVGQEKLGMFAALGGVFRNGGLSINTSLLSDGSASPNGAALKLDVEGAVGATKYCDENGENCFTARGGGGGGIKPTWVHIPPGGWYGYGTTMYYPDDRGNPELICRRAGFTTFAGSCRNVRVPGQETRGSVAANDMDNGSGPKGWEKGWHIICMWGSGDGQAHADNMEILCL